MDTFWLAQWYTTDAHAVNIVDRDSCDWSQSTMRRFSGGMAGEPQQFSLSWVRSINVDGDDRFVVIL